MEDHILDSGIGGPFQPPHRVPLPNAIATLVLGICSIVTCICYGVVGLICGIVALIISKNAVMLHRENPEAYSDWSMVRAGRICAVIGICLSSIFLIILLGYLIFLQTLFSLAGAFLQQ